MTTWTNDELTQIGTAEELEIASRRRDDSLSRPATIWVVPSGEDLYVRSVNGPNCPAATVASSARRLAERMEAERQKGSYFV
jgi:hypothetical protein